MFGALMTSTRSREKPEDLAILSTVLSFETRATDRGTSGNFIPHVIGNPTAELPTPSRSLNPPQINKSLQNGAPDPLPQLSPKVFGNVN